MYVIRRSDSFDRWLRGLRDKRAKARILARIKSAELGNLGDHKSVGGGVSELRVHCGPGYRVYYTVRDRALLLLLIGGEKSSQSRDVEKAKAVLRSWEVFHE